MKQDITGDALTQFKCEVGAMFWHSAIHYYMLDWFSRSSTFGVIFGACCLM